ncbi:MAG: alpha-L-fucosidase [Phycisphaerales bacterium]
MPRTAFASLLAVVMLACSPALGASEEMRGRAPATIGSADDAKRLSWWTEARLGMFIHWGLYAIPAGRWGEATGHGEWIRDSAKIPLAEYDGLVKQFNPVKFNAEEIVLAAKNAGMGYITITTKHHDGFCLFDTATTDFDVMSTPFKRDIMKEMADACRRHGLRICWYYSIMDWHHPDYLPRRPWETDRPTKGADFDRYIQYMKAQLRELLTNYGEIGVLWFDGQWEGSWNDERGADLQAFVRQLQPSIIINSRVGRGGGSYGLDGARLGDYSTPEQFIPETTPAGPWETCMTMNDHWGYNAKDMNFKPARTLIRNTVDIASKGGNFLLNIGPTALGEIPAVSVERLERLGGWMRQHGEAVRGTSASPFPTSFPWGRCTQRAHPVGGGPGTRLFLTILEPPTSGVLVLPGLLNTPAGAALIGDGEPHVLSASVVDGGVSITLPGSGAGLEDRVVTLDLPGVPDVALPPFVEAPSAIFIDTLSVRIGSAQAGVDVRYTLDGSTPGPASPLAAPGTPVELRASAKVRARSFRGSRAISPLTDAEFQRVTARPAAPVAVRSPGLRYEAFTTERDIQSVRELVTPVSRGITPAFDLARRPRDRNFGMRFTGFVTVPSDGVYRFFTTSDDGSTLHIGDTLVVDNDKPHSAEERSGVVALARGAHPITVTFFENWGGYDLKVGWSGPGVERGRIPASALSLDP